MSLIFVDDIIMQIHKLIIWTLGHGELQKFAHFMIFIQDNYSKICLKRPLKNRQYKGFKDKW